MTKLGIIAVAAANKPAFSPAQRERNQIIERCAQVAENYHSDNPYPTIQSAIAAAIRALANEQ